MNTAKLVNKVRVFGVLAILALGVTTLPFSNALAAEGLSYERLECVINDTPFRLTIMMPSSFTAEQKEAEAQKVCDSIEPARLDRATLEATRAVCDTDMNCEYWDRYHQYGLEKIFVAYDDEETNERVLVILCKDNPTPIFTNNPDKLKTICEENKNAKP